MRSSIHRFTKMMQKRARLWLNSITVDVQKRELGELSNRNFAHRIAASEDLLLRLDVLMKLDKHRGCVNTVSFNSVGDILVSGSDDRSIILWDWEVGRIKLSFHSGHQKNVFQAKFMPFSQDRSIVTCAADGQVRHAQILDSGKVETKLLAKHKGRAHKLAIQPGSPHIFYTCGEDGLVQNIDLRTGAATSLFTCKPMRSNQTHLSTIHLNAIAINQRNSNLFAVGGSDQFARLFDVRRYKRDGSSIFGPPVDIFCPPHLVDDDRIGITGLEFSYQSELLVSYTDEFIYLVTQGQSQDAGHARDSPQAYKGHRNRRTVKGVSFFGPRCDYVVSGSDCGRIFIWRKRDGKLIRVMEGDNHVVNCIEPHPHATMLASSGIERDIKLWIPKAVHKAVLPTDIQNEQDGFDFGI